MASPSSLPSLDGLQRAIQALTNRIDAAFGGGAARPAGLPTATGRDELAATQAAGKAAVAAAQAVLATAKNNLDSAKATADAALQGVVAGGKAAVAAAQGVLATAKTNLDSAKATAAAAIQGALADVATAKVNLASALLGGDKKEIKDARGDLGTANAIKNAIAAQNKLDLQPFEEAVKNAAAVFATIKQSAAGSVDREKTSGIASLKPFEDAVKAAAAAFKSVRQSAAESVDKARAEQKALPTALAVKDEGGAPSKPKAAGKGFSPITLAAVAFNQVSAAIDKFIGILEQFVGALNPALVEVLNFTFRDLTAVIGYALQPVMMAVIPVVRGFADALFPVARQLAPIFGRIADILSARLQPFIDLFATALQALVPLLNIYADIQEKLQPVFTVMAQVLGLLIEAVKPVLDIFGTLISVLVPILSMLLSAILPLIGLFAVFAQLTTDITKMFLDLIATPIIKWMNMIAGLMSDWAKVLMPLITAFSDIAAGVLAQVKDALEYVVATLLSLVGIDTGGFEEMLKSITHWFQEVAKAAVLLLAGFFKIIGFTSGLNALIKAFGPKDPSANRESTVGLAAATNPAFKNIEQVGKDAALGAFTSSIYGQLGKEKPKEKTEDFLAGMEVDLKKIAEAKTTAELLTALKDASTVLSNMYNWLQNHVPTKEGIHSATNAVGNSGVVSALSPALALGAKALGKIF